VWYKLDDQAYDQVVTDSQGTFTGLSNANTIDRTAAGKSGTSLHFDGYYDGVTCYPAPMALTAFTVNVWVNLDYDSSSYWTRFVDKGDGGYSTTFIIGQSGIDGSIYFGLFDGANQYACYTGTAIPNGEWAMITGTWDGSVMKTYLNGVFQSQADFAGTIYNSDGPLSIGTSTDWESKSTGYFDEVRIYDNAMTQEQITALYATY